MRQIWKINTVDVILGIKKPDRGKFLVNETREVKNIFPYVSYVPQNVFLFDDTISSNITFSEENLNMNKLNKVVKVSKLENFISSLPKNFKTIIGEKGSKHQEDNHKE